MPYFETLLRFSAILLSNKSTHGIRNTSSFYFRYYGNQARIVKSKIPKHRPEENILMKYFKLSPEKYSAIIKSDDFLLHLEPDHIKKCLDTCLHFDLSKDVILDHLSILQPDHVFLQSKLNIISKMNFTNINHGVPFLQHSARQLVKLCASIKKEEDDIPSKNRLYYLSEKLQLDAQILGKIVARRLFIYKIAFESLQKTMDVLLDAGVNPENIVKDLWILNYNHATVQNRLKQFQAVETKKLMPWMARCTERNMRRSMDITTRTDELLKNDNSTHSYLAKRLNCTNETVLEMIQKIPSISTINVGKVCDTLDFLFSEGYTETDIINVPRSFACSLNTLKNRQQILKSYDINYRNLICLCKSKKSFKDFVEKMQKLKVRSDENK